jgi:hypothetical protein
MIFPTLEGLFDSKKPGEVVLNEIAACHIPRSQILWSALSLQSLDAHVSVIFEVGEIHILQVSGSRTPTSRNPFPQQSFCWSMHLIIF